ncbi:MAG: hypothetical protein PsegKO_30510 [Pseudohongiellaceae bacterium]
MKTGYKLIVVFLTLSLAIAAGYYFGSPKIILNNLSNNEYDEFVIQLPSSRISFSPIAARQSNTIFYSRQKATGTVSYSLVKSDSVIFRGDFPYADGNEIGRVLRFTIDTNGQIAIGR